MTTPAPTRAGLAIIGCGYMGGHGLLAFKNLKDLMGMEIAPDLVMIVEPDERNFRLFADYCYRDPQLNRIPPSFTTWEDGFSYLLNISSRDNFPIIIYDATPVPLHAGHFSDVHDSGQKNLIYMGEKPLISDPAEIDRIRGFDPQFPIFCELIESVNPVVRHVKQYIDEEKLNVSGLWFWRANGSGLNKLIHADRNGVQGGALLDKAPHDFSISMNLLGPDGVCGIEVDGEIHALIPHSDYLDRNVRLILTASNRSSPKITTETRYRDELPADGLSSVNMIWRSPFHGNVPAHYLFSWLGITGHREEGRFIGKLKQLGFDYKDYVLRHVESGPHADLHPLAIEEAPQQSPKWHARNQEIRIGIVECPDRTIVCSFLTEGSGRIQRCAHVSFKNTCAQSLELEIGQHARVAREQIKGMELAEMFASALRQYLSGKQSQFLTRHLLLETHRVMFQAHDSAIAKLNPHAFDRWFDCSTEIVRHKVYKGRQEAGMVADRASPESIGLRQDSA